MRRMAARLSALLYVSTGVRLFEDTELFELLEQSRLDNRRFETTGMLLYFDGTFAEVLEGMEDSVREAHSRTREDARHKDVTVMIKTPIERRYFPEWLMAFEANEPGKPEGYISLKQAADRLAAATLSRLDLRCLRLFLDLWLAPYASIISN